jgi:hypothetical protein
MAPGVGILYPIASALFFPEYSGAESAGIIDESKYTGEKLVLY